MNIAVINLKSIIKYFIVIVLTIFLITHFTKNISETDNYLGGKIVVNINNIIKNISRNIPVFMTQEEISEEKVNIEKIVGLEIALFNNIEKTQDTKIEQPNNIVQETIILPEQTDIEQITEISKTAQTEKVTDRNFEAYSNTIYQTTKIDNQSDYTLTQEMLIPDVELTNKTDVLIYHTHTCESYTPCDTYNYEMTGNYRTTDSNYNVVRVGEELKTYLTQKGFNVTHDATYHDYPSYSGSYSRSLETGKKILEGTTTEIVIDLHRDAIGNGDTYGPTILVDGQRVAQLMFVIGTDGGGLEHPNWIQNLKVAIKVQEKANEMYPGLFRPIIIRNSRYNQHLAKGASIIEVGATANTLGECLLSMQCLANVLEEVYR